MSRPGGALNEPRKRLPFAGQCIRLQVIEGWGKSRHPWFCTAEINRPLFILFYFERNIEPIEPIDMVYRNQRTKML